MSDDKKITEQEMKQAAGAGPGFIQADGSYAKDDNAVHEDELKKVAGAGPGFLQKDGSYAKDDTSGTTGSTHVDK